MKITAKNLLVPLLSVFSLAAAYVVAETTICFEAEDTKEIKAPVKMTEVKEKTEAAQVSGEKLIEIEQGAGEGSKAGGSAKYKVDIKEDGTYYVWARCWWLDSCGNSFGMKIGDKPEFIMGNDGTYKSWHWIKSKVSIKLDKGAYDIEILNREDGIKIDQILITNDRKLVPVDIEKSEKLSQ